MNHSMEFRKIVIDLGNSRAKVAVFNQNEICTLFHIGNPTPEKLLNLEIDYTSVKSGIISSVAADTISYTQVLPAINWIHLNEMTPVPVNNSYKTPATLGKDRLAAVTGGHHLYPGRDLLIIDAGTAVTYDFINCNGVYIGGSISPGLSMRFAALNTFTSRLPLLKIQEIDFLTGRDTTESILSGVIHGIRLEMDGIINEYKLMWPTVITIMTGGDAEYFEKILKNNIFVTPNLVLTGLKLILDYNLEK
ncbi:MAG: type III pantothenate kinase [Bacteroidota bacterium]